ncbi:hypothetical protein ACFL4V_01270 [Candidatus Latescibacterota bacterium]
MTGAWGISLFGIVCLHNVGIHIKKIPKDSNHCNLFFTCTMTVSARTLKPIQQVRFKIADPTAMIRDGIENSKRPNTLDV